MINPGIYKSTELSGDDYHADKESYSRTSLMEFKRSQKYFQKMREEGAPVKDKTPDMIFGSAFHTLILEPHLFSDLYAIEPERVYLKYHGKEAYENYKAHLAELEKTDKIILSDKEYKALKGMANALFEDEDARELIEGAIYEQSYFWQDEHTGLILKSRPDIIKGNIYIDIKTAKDASPSGFQKAMAEGGNHIQGALVRDGCMQLERRKIEAVINICIEKEYPYLIGNYMIDEEALAYGKTEYKNILLDLKSALSHNSFAGYGIQTIGLPGWYK